jgi:hypothetical protein
MLALLRLRLRLPRFDREEDIISSSSSSNSAML